MSDPDDRSVPPDLDDPEAPATEDELAEARRLRDALQDPAAESQDAALARALSSAWSPRDLSPEAHRILIDGALERHDAARAARRAAQRKRRGTVVRVTFGVAALAAMAAALLLVVRSDRQAPEGARVVAAVAVSRSTQGLFTDRFAATGGESARIDRIAVARAADLRDNEFARWGVR